MGSLQWRSGHNASPEETIKLKRRVRSATVAYREGGRVGIILLAAESETRDNIARLSGFSCTTITQSFSVSRHINRWTTSWDANHHCLRRPSAVSWNRSSDLASGNRAGAIRAWQGRRAFPRPPPINHGPCCSCMSVEKRFSQDTAAYIRDGKFASVLELKRSITTFLASGDAEPTLCVWSAKGA